MAATVYHGADGTISVAVEPGPAGDKAKTVIDKYSLTPIGRARGVTVRVTNDVKPFHELELTRFRRRCWGERKKEAPMLRTHPPYAPEYRRRIIELARTGRPIAQLARESEASANAIRKWVKQAGLDEGLRSDGLTTAEREELNRLRRENRVLREEREILSKAAAWFATETGSVPSRRSNS